MTRPAQSVFAFAIYLIGMGTSLVVMPNTVLALLGFPASSEIWPRVVGVLALVLAFYYIRAARRELTEFFRWTVQARALVFVVFAAFVVLRLAPLPLVFVGTADLLAAIWTGLALRSRPASWCAH